MQKFNKTFSKKKKKRKIRAYLVAEFKNKKLGPTKNFLFGQLH